MGNIRQQKIQELILHELGNYIRLKNAEWCRGTMLTVTKVKISPDYSFAKVYISIFGNANHLSVLETIKNHAKEIRYNLGNNLRHQLRIIPEMAFVEDDSLDYIENIDKLLKNNE